MQEDYGIELKLITKALKNELNQTMTLIKNWGKKAEESATVTPKMKYSINDFGKEFDSEESVRKFRLLGYDAYWNDLEKTMVLKSQVRSETIALAEAEKILQEEQQKTGHISVTQTQKMVTNFDNLGKNARRFILSLFSIRSVWALISRASSTYLSENEQVNQSVRLTASIFGNILAPVIKKVVDIAQYGAIIIAKIIQLFTGYNALANTTANAMKGVTKAGKEMNKSLASFDTITNLGDNTSGIASGIADSVKALDDFQEKIAKVEEIFNKYEPAIKTATVALGVMFGASMLSKIKNILGVAGTGATATGATGLLGVLSVIGLLAVNAVVIPIAVKGIDKVIKEAKTLNEMLNQTKELSKGLAEQTNKTADELEQLALSGEKSNDWLKKYYDWLLLVIDSNEEENQKLNKQYTIFGWLTGGMKTAQQQQEINNQTNAEMIQKLKNLNEYLEKQNQNLDKNSQEYKQNKEMIEQTKKKIEELTSRNYSTTVELKMDTAQAERSYSSFTSRLGHTISTLLDPNNWGSGFTSKISSIWRGNSYAVGTNYVPNDQLAMVHKGEMIVPAKYNPMTSNIGSGNDETNSLLRTLITTLENKDMNAYISPREIGEVATNYINTETRISGRSVLL